MQEIHLLCDAEVLILFRFVSLMIALGRQYTIIDDLSTGRKCVPKAGHDLCTHLASKAFKLAQVGHSVCTKCYSLDKSGSIKLDF